jgi:acyl-CoA synthetase (AMP-forming)/AMP-acid ligase II
MLGLMQNEPLLLSNAIRHAARWHGTAEIVSQTVEGPIHRTTYAELYVRTCQLANALRDQLGVKPGDILATMAWNTYRHLEIFYAVMGQGAVVHTLNPRLFIEQLDYIINHAQDQWLFLDLTFVPLLEKLQDKLATVKGFIIMTDAAHMPKTTLRNVYCYEDLLASGAETFDWPSFDENTASSLCYTSGTTGNPKGVLYSHRSHMLHGLTSIQPDVAGYRSCDRMIMTAPMFHANGWGVPFMSPMVGMALVLPGAKYEAASLYELMVTERTTTASFIPTLLTGLYHYLEDDSARKLPDMQRIFVGGTALPSFLISEFREKHALPVIHVWGMTETSPIGACGTATPAIAHLSETERHRILAKQGRSPFLVDLRITDDDNISTNHDGRSNGRLKIKGPFIADGYFRAEVAKSTDSDGWFDTGDVATIDEWGFMQVTDRSKDLIKSGGEWISSIDLENAVMSCTGVAEAAAIALPHPKWDERPLLIVVRKSGSEVSKGEIMAHLTDKIAKWWLPDDIAFVTEIPHTATGKISKLQLRELFKDFVLPTATDQR